MRYFATLSLYEACWNFVIRDVGTSFYAMRRNFVLRGVSEIRYTRNIPSLLYTYSGVPGFVI